MLNSDSSHRLLHCILHLGYQAKFKVPVLEDRVAITNKKLVDKLENYHGLTAWCTLHIALPLSLLEIFNQQKKILTTIKTAKQTLSPVNSPLPDDFSQFFVPWIPLHSRVNETIRIPNGMLDGWRGEGWEPACSSQEEQLQYFKIFIPLEEFFLAMVSMSVQ